MFIITHLLWGILAVVAGVVAIKYNFQLVGLTGRQEWIERRLGSGSTYLAFNIVSIGLILFGILYATGLWTPVGNWLFSPLRGLIFNQPGTP